MLVVSSMGPGWVKDERFFGGQYLLEQIFRFGCTARHTPRCVEKARLFRFPPFVQLVIIFKYLAISKIGTTKI